LEIPSSSFSNAGNWRGLSSSHGICLASLSVDVSLQLGSPLAPPVNTPCALREGA
jgi:hypothetical protein